MGDYEAVIVELDWASLIGAHGAQSAFTGQATEVGEELVAETAAALEERSSELERFLASGGIMVVKVQPRSTMWSKGAHYLSQLVEVDTISWLSDKVFPLMYPGLAGGSTAFLTGSGSGIDIRELDHPLEAVIRGATEYTGRIAKEVFDVNDTIVLATTLIGDPVSAEISVGNGLVFLLPSGVDDEELIAALEAILATREQHRQTWLLPQEIALIDAAKIVQAEARAKLASLATERQMFIDLRASVMKKVNVARAVSYYENGTSPTRPVERSMHDLYKLVDLLEDYFGGSEEKLAAGLGIPKSLFKDSIKRLANQKQFDFRHAESGETVGADVAKVEQAQRDARELVQRFIEHCCDEELAARAAPAETAKA